MRSQHTLAGLLAAPGGSAEVARRGAQSLIDALGQPQQRLDSVEMHMGATPIEVRPDGSKVYRGTAAFGDVVKRYPDLVPPRNEFVPAAELMSAEALATLPGLRFTAGERARDFDGRVSVTADHRRDRRLTDPDSEEVDGAVLRGWRHDSGVPGEPPELKVDVIVYSRAAQDLLERGVRDLSFGLRTSVERHDGEHHGTAYQYVQRHIQYYHLNLVRSARSRSPSGRSARLDSYPHVAGGRGAPQDTTTMRKYKSLLTSVLAALPPPPVVDPAAAAASPDVDDRTDAAMVLSDEDAALLKQMSPDVQAAMSAALGLAMAEDEAGAAVEEAAEEMADEAEEAAEDVAPAADLASLAKQMAAIVAGLEAAGIKVERTDGERPVAAAPVTPAVPKPKAPMKPTVRTDSAKPATIDADSVIAQATAAARQAASDQFAADSRLVSAVRLDGHEVATPHDAAVVMLTTIKRHLPGLGEMAEQMVKEQRLDSLTPIYRQAEDLRRADLTGAQGLHISRVLAAADVAGTAPAGNVIRRPSAQ